MLKLNAEREDFDALQTRFNVLEKRINRLQGGGGAINECDVSVDNVDDAALLDGAESPGNSREFGSRMEMLESMLREKTEEVKRLRSEEVGGRNHVVTEEVGRNHVVTEEGGSPHGGRTREERKEGSPHGGRTREERKEEALRAS